MPIIKIDLQGSQTGSTVDGKYFQLDFGAIPDIVWLVGGQEISNGTEPFGSILFQYELISNHMVLV